MSNVEIAKNTLEDILESPTEARGLREAGASVIEAGDPDGLELLAVVLELHPEIELVDGLWGLAESADTRRRARSFAMQCIASVLVSAKIALERATEKNVLERDELDAHVRRLMALYNDDGLDSHLRRRALEMAANASNDEAIVAAGNKALGSDDPKWAATGLFVARITQPNRARELVEAAIEHPAEDVRFEAIAGLADLGDDQDYTRLKDFIYDGSQDERLAALWALAEIPDERAGDALVEATRWLQGEAQYQAQEANAEWIEQWADVLASGEEVESRSTRVVSSRRGLDRYLSDDFLGDD